MISRIRPRHLAGTLAAGACIVALAPGGAAQAASGITPVSPKSGATVPVGKSPTFKMRVKLSGHVWVHVCKSKKKNKEGVICSTASIGEAKKHGSVYTYKVKFFDFPEFWLNTPGTYYWQAHRIDCGTGSDCLQEAPIVKFKVG